MNAIAEAAREHLRSNPLHDPRRAAYLRKYNKAELARMAEAHLNMEPTDIEPPVPTNYWPCLRIENPRRLSKRQLIRLIEIEEQRIWPDEREKW